MVQQQNTFSLDIDLRSGHPIYIQIADQLRSMIVSGVLKSGDQLPTVRMLAETLSVNFNTVAKAYRILDEEGLILTQQGRGSFISGPVTEQERDLLRWQTLETLTERYLSEVYRLGFSVDEVAVAFKGYLALDEMVLTS